MTLSVLPLFLASMIPLMLTPGPVKLFLLGISVSRGAWYGGLIALGIYLSDLAHVLLSALGVGALLAKNPALFDWIRLGGGGYLAYLAYQSLAKYWLLHSLPTAFDPALSAHESGWRYFSSGLLINLFNPISLVFYLSFLPQFIQADASLSASSQMLLYGVSMVSVFFVFHLILVLCCGAVKGALSQQGLRFAKLQALLVGLVFSLLALRVLSQLSWFSE